MLLLRRLPDSDLSKGLFTSQTPAGEIALAEFFGPVLAPAEAQALGVLDLAGTAEAEALAKGQAAGTLDLAGAATAAARVKGQAAGALDLAGSAAAKALAKGQAAGSLDLAGQAAAVAPAKGQAAGALDLGGQAEAVAPASGQAAGTLDLSGVATAEVLPLPDYSTGRLAFASWEPRQGEILTRGIRSGRLLNVPRPAGRIITEAREGTLMNPVRRGHLLEIA